MKLNLFRLFIPLILMLAIDIYFFQAVKTLMSGSSPISRKIVIIGFWAITTLAITLLLSASFTNWHEWPKFIKTYVFGVIVILYLSKIVSLPFLAMDDLIRLGKYVFSKGSTTSDAQSTAGLPISRSQFLMGTALVAAAIPFGTLVYGIINGPYLFVVRKMKLVFKNLPVAFNGIKIIQLSDIHTGSWESPAHMQKAVDLINKQGADMVLFTGDLVNNLSEEAYPFIPVLKQIKAPLGVYSSLGNHDYGDYSQWESEADKSKNMEAMYQIHRDLGWKLLRNENILIRRDNESIALAGCENWGASLRFTKYGDINKTLKGIDAPFTILMSHDPSHWEAQILSHPHHVDLTLAGHTHGMQFGADFKSFRWSPAQWFYKQWADLYQKNDKYIYVNRGLGFIGYPGRVGVKAEIAVFELSC